MSLDITITRKRDVFCPHCGEPIELREVAEERSGGRVWYPFLEKVGYYGENSPWYGEDMVLTREQSDRLYRFCKNEQPYNHYAIMRMVAMAQAEGQAVVINADW